MQRTLDCILKNFGFRISTKEKMEKLIEQLMKNCPESERYQYLTKYNRFLDMFDKFLLQKKSKIQWENIQFLSPDSFFHYDNLPLPVDDQIKIHLSKLVIVKLNGGLGTNMNCDGAKSLLIVRNDFTFLDLIVQQIVGLNNEYDVDIPLVLMNSFNTHEDTLAATEKYSHFRISIFNFTQSRFPRMYSTTYKLVPNSYNDGNKHAWYPPGHGDFYESFYLSGLLQTLMEKGKDICMVSNVDNLGATVNFPLLNKMMNSNQVMDFLMEVTPKTKVDIKGGIVVKMENKFHLLEVAQVPPENLNEFQNGEHFKVFNTNNLWIRLESILKLVEEKRHLLMDVIVNHKTLRGSVVPHGVIQLETAIGSAIHLFENTIGVVVPRCRFLPVKTTSDFFLVKSNAYELRNGNLLLNPLRYEPYPPQIELTGKEFTSYLEIYKRFPEMPDCLNLLSLQVSGDVVFGKSIVLKGNVVIKAKSGEKIYVPDKTVLQDCQILTPFS